MILRTVESPMSTVEELGNQAYKKALFQDFQGAISILDRAISKFPCDPRLYNNRSYCYFKLKDYKNALTDAEFMVNKFPSYSKSYYRKAEALIELGKCKEAELALRECLQLEPKCEEVRFLLSEVQITILCSTGEYWVQDAVRALKLTDHDTAKAAQFLKVGGRKGTNSYSASEIYQSDEEVDAQSTSAFSNSARSTNDPEYDPYTDPSNPLNCCSIWVGNVTKRVTIDRLKAIFGKYGKFKGDIIVHQNSCAFVNYTDPRMAATAMKKFPQHYPVEDTFLVIRYPLNNTKVNHTNLVTSGKKSCIKIR